MEKENLKARIRSAVEVAGGMATAALIACSSGEAKNNHTPPQENVLGITPVATDPRPTATIEIKATSTPEPELSIEERSLNYAKEIQPGIEKMNYDSTRDKRDTEGKIQKFYKTELSGKQIAITTQEKDNKLINITVQIPENNVSDSEFTITSISSVFAKYSPVPAEAIWTRSEILGFPALQTDWKNPDQGKLAGTREQRVAFKSQGQSVAYLNFTRIFD